MRRILLPVLLTLALTACNSSDNSDSGSPGDNSQSNITIPNDSREALQTLSNIAFNGQYETTARTDLGSGRGETLGSETDDGAITASSPDTSGSSASDPDVGTDSSATVLGPTNPTQSIEPGTLTAGDHDDHLNPHLYQNYANDYLQRRGQSMDIPRMDFNHRIRIEVTDKAGVPQTDARVEVTRARAQSTLTLHTAANGVSSLYSALDRLPENFKLKVTSTDGTTVQQDINLQQATDAGKILVSLATGDQGQSNSITPIDLMFVMDTTGSMTDELNFLQTELSDIINAITLQQPDIKIGLVFYRDYGDAYIVRAHGFSENLNNVQLNLNQEQANGGGDYPEAMDQALQAALSADWRATSHKILFLIADAPPHGDRMRATWTAAEQARLKNIHIVPVAASGVAEDAEYIMRSAAALTNSRYLFLTDDSGYGLPHAEPEIDCYVVTSLRKSMIRTLNSLVTGVRIEPSSNDVIRQVGDYNNGVCDQAKPLIVPGTVDSTVLIDRQFPLNGTFTDKQIQVITNTETLNDKLSEYGEALVSVDFDTGQVVLVDSGQKSSGGFAVKIASFNEYDDYVLANVVFTLPGRNCGVAAALTNPYKLVYVATRKEIRVSETSISTDCS